MVDLPRELDFFLRNFEMPQEDKTLLQKLTSEQLDSIFTPQDHKESFPEYDFLSGTKELLVAANQRRKPQDQILVDTKKFQQAYKTTAQVKNCQEALAAYQQAAARVTQGHVEKRPAQYLLDTPFQQLVADQTVPLINIILTALNPIPCFGIEYATKLLAYYFMVSHKNEDEGLERLVDLFIMIATSPSLVTGGVKDDQMPKYVIHALQRLNKQVQLPPKALMRINHYLYKQDDQQLIDDFVTACDATEECSSPLDCPQNERMAAQITAELLSHIRNMNLLAYIAELEPYECATSEIGEFLERLRSKAVEHVQSQNDVEDVAAVQQSLLKLRNFQAAFTIAQAVTDDKIRNVVKTWQARHRNSLKTEQQVMDEWRHCRERPQVPLIDKTLQELAISSGEVLVQGEGLRDVPKLCEVIARATELQESLGGYSADIAWDGQADIDYMW